MGNRRALCCFSARNFSISTKPGSSKTGSVSGGHDQAGHPTGHGRGHFAVQHAGVLVPRLAQAHGQIDQAGQHQAAAGIDGSCGGKMGRGRADGDDLAVGNRHIPTWSRPEAGSMTRPLRINMCIVFTI